MKTITLAIGLVAALALPALATAKPPVDQANMQAAHAQCKTLRGATKATREAFKAEHHSMSRCVREKAAEEAAEEAAAHKNAAKECKAEAADPKFADTHDNKSFAEFYGANGNGKNAHGKCVSAKAKEKKAEMDAEDAEAAVEFKNAAKTCAEERRSLGTTEFAKKYGTNRNKRNAFGKCVSKHVADDSD
jgi:superfamily II DNA helicase RecQ